MTVEAAAESYRKAKKDLAKAPPFDRRSALENRRARAEVALLNAVSTLIGKDVCVVRVSDGPIDPDLA